MAAADRRGVIRTSLSGADAKLAVRMLVRHPGLSLAREVQAHLQLLEDGSAGQG